MSKICVNNRVYENYRSGMTLDDAIAKEFRDEIAERRAKNSAFMEMSPMDMVMFDAKISSKYSDVGAIMDASEQYTSGGLESNSWLFPAWVDSTLHEAIYENDIIQYLVNNTVGVDSNIVQSAMLDLTSDKNINSIKRARIAESADLPLAKITISEKAITLWKHGRALQMSYEAVRRIQIPMWQQHMSAIVQDLAHQNLEFAADVLLNGDGNNNAATKIQDVTVSGGKVTNRNLLEAMIKYWRKNHFVADTIVAGEKDYFDIAEMTYDSQLAPGASVRLSFNLPQIGEMRPTVLLADNMKVGGKDVITFSNRANSLIRYTENGSSIQETQSFIRNQTNLMTFSENSGYAIGTAGSNMYVKTGA